MGGNGEALVMAWTCEAPAHSFPVVLGCEQLQLRRHQVERSRGHGALQHVELYVFAGNDAITAQHALYGLAGQFGMVVLFREVAEPHVAQLLAHVLGYSLAAGCVVQMSAAALYTFFQVLGVGSVLQHLTVVVGLQHKEIGPPNKRGHLVGDVSHIGHDTEAHALSLNHIAHVVATVVGHTEGRHAKLAQVERNTGLHIAAQLGRHLARNAVVAVYAMVDGLGGIDGQTELMTHAAHALYVVGMVMGDEQMVYLAKALTVVLHVTLQQAHTNARIDEQSVVVGQQLIAVSAAPTAKRYESEHFYLIFCCFYLNRKVNTFS